jgi:hypothetical protein
MYMGVKRRLPVKGLEAVKKVFVGESDEVRKD